MTESYGFIMKTFVVRMLYEPKVHYFYCWKQAMSTLMCSCVDLYQNNYSSLKNILFQRSSISGPRAKSGPRRLNNWPAEQRQNAEEIYYNFFKIHLSVLTIYIFIFIVNESLILVKFCSVMQDALQLL